MTLGLPISTKTIVVRRPQEERNPAYDDAVLVEQSIPSLKKGQILVKTAAAAFNRKDVSQYFFSLASRY
jgi:NADPH:quinone reductase-like Zn-dependent oxidoreductase